VSRYQKGNTNLDFTEARHSEWPWHHLGHMQVCTLLQADNHASTSPLSLYRPDALPDAQPTASKHWRQFKCYSQKINNHSDTTCLLVTDIHKNPHNGHFSTANCVSQKGKASLDFNEAKDYRVLGWQWHWSGNMKTICTSLQTDNHNNTSSRNFYRPNALSDARPTVSKH